MLAFRIGMETTMIERRVIKDSPGGHKARHYILCSSRVTNRFLTRRIKLIYNRYYFFLNPVKIQIIPQAMATGPTPKYRNGGSGRCQGSK